MHRAQESERPDALFHDPYARMLAGERGEQIARSLGYGLAGWPVVARTVFFDRQIKALITEGKVECVLNLAAGLDARPYRLELPPDLLWIEADLPDMVAYKDELLKGRPSCRLERVAADLSDPAARRRVFDLTDDVPCVVLTEGLLVYLEESDVVALAKDLAGRENVKYWLADLSGPQAAQWGNRGRIGRQLALANAAHRFAPEEGPAFFQPFGWAPLEVQSSWKESKRLGRLPAWLGALELVTPRTRRDPYYNLARVVLFERSSASASRM